MLAAELATCVPVLSPFVSKCNGKYQLMFFFGRTRGAPVRSLAPEGCRAETLRDPRYCDYRCGPGWSVSTRSSRGERGQAFAYMDGVSLRVFS